MEKEIDVVPPVNSFLSVKISKIDQKYNTKS